MGEREGWDEMGGDGDVRRGERETREGRGEGGWEEKEEERRGQVTFR